ncbi:hypothetical protein H5410_037528 [Solanum commersonii]|uniref:Uncharacterized protein n=1 Tax=Solanum commersonii TaxID=4109 RepID=A0A9J5Y9S8_SOLCO|nr:hypothetical protein H5410_037528 [Solanum commersonii]
MKRINKIENELEKVRKENKKMEFTNQVYGLLNGEEMPNSMHPEDLSDLSYVINKSLKQINDAIKAKTHEEINNPLKEDEEEDPMMSSTSSSMMTTFSKRKRLILR